VSVPARDLVQIGLDDKGGRGRGVVAIPEDCLPQPPKGDKLKAVKPL